jgi:endonuclease/exonuclease/phosphatase family metal-dependent hydrolase
VVLRRLPPVLFALVVYGCSSDDHVLQQPPPTTPGDDAAADDDAVGGDAVDAEQPEAWTPAPLRVVTWNVHDFYDDIANNCQDCPYEPTPKTTSEYQSKISQVGGILAKLAGDVVMLEEIENIGVLEKLAGSSALASLQYQYRYLFRGNDPRGINMGFLSRYPVDNAISHKDEQFTEIVNPGKVYDFTRDALEIHMRYRGKHVALVGVHFKAKSGTDDFAENRLAEAEQARKIADGILTGDSSAYVWVLGDFNDSTGSPPYLAVQNGKSGPKYEDVASKAPTADQYSFIYDNQKSLIDHMFASPGAFQRLVSNSVTIQHGALPSDHAPIAATFQVP